MQIYTVQRSDKGIRLGIVRHCEMQHILCKKNPGLYRQRRPFHAPVSA